MNLVFIVILILMAGQARAQDLFTKISDAIITSDAGTIQKGVAFPGIGNKERSVTDKGWQYYAFYNKVQHICVARRKLPNGDWQVVELKDYVHMNTDGHRTINLGLSPKDGTLHLAFDHHNTPLHYRVSKVGVTSTPESVLWNADLFSEVRDYLVPGKGLKPFTYPRFVTVPDGNLLFYFRLGASGNGNSFYSFYDGSTQKWSEYKMFINKGGMYSDHFNDSEADRSAYPNPATFEPDGKLHFTWVWRERAAGNNGRGDNHDINYIYSDDMGKTWKGNNDKPLSQFPPDVNTPHVKVVEIIRGYGLVNDGAQTIDAQGRVHVMMRHTTDESMAAVAKQYPGIAYTNPVMTYGVPEAWRFHHYIRESDGTWSHRQLPNPFGEVVSDDESNVYFVVVGEKSLVVYRSTAAANWKDMQPVYSQAINNAYPAKADMSRWANEKVLSLTYQEMPIQNETYTKIRVIDLKLVGGGSTSLKDAIKGSSKRSISYSRNGKFQPGSFKVTLPQGENVLSFQIIRLDGTVAFRSAPTIHAASNVLLFENDGRLDNGIYFVTFSHVNQQQTFRVWVSP